MVVVVAVVVVDVVGIAVVQFCVAFDCESAFWGARGGGTQVINVLSSRKFPEEFPKTSAAVGSWMVDDHD